MFQVAAVLAGLLCCARAGHALDAGGLLLVVNRNDPDGLALAEFYRTARLVPDGRIVELDLPQSDEMAFAVYEREVVRPLRQFMRDNALESKVVCILTFHGVPLRIGARPYGDAEKREVAGIRAEQQAAKARSIEAIETLERRVREVRPAFTPRAGQTLEDLGARAEAALTTWASLIGTASDNAQRARMTSELVEGTRLLGGPAAVARIFKGPATTQSSDPRRFGAGAASGAGADRDRRDRAAGR